ncbi:hypothetical protein NH340_JMT07551 [Sarcoptes scabiei]|nr:hypothetical protein NH340_JMT07551 [Sarcoptes scabiei]
MMIELRSLIFLLMAIGCLADSSLESSSSSASPPPPPSPSYISASLSDEIDETNIGAKVGLPCLGKFSCKSKTFPFHTRCLKLDRLCDEKEDCANGMDENNALCDHLRDLQQENDDLRESLERSRDSRKHGEHDGGIENDFSGTGFMFSVNNLIIEGSDVKMFNQNSDNVSGQKDSQEPSDKSNHTAIEGR